jgi:hypothetical protein
MVHLCFCRLRKVLIALPVFVFVCARVCVCVYVCGGGIPTMRNSKTPLLFYP